MEISNFLSTLQKLNYPRINKLSQSNIEWISSLPNINSLLSFLSQINNDNIINDIDINHYQSLIDTGRVLYDDALENAKQSSGISSPSSSSFSSSTENTHTDTSSNYDDLIASLTSQIDAHTQYINTLRSSLHESILRRDQLSIALLKKDEEMKNHIYLQRILHNTNNNNIYTQLLNQQKIIEQELYNCKNTAEKIKFVLFNIQTDNDKDEEEDEEKPENHELIIHSSFVPSSSTSSSSFSSPFLSMYSQGKFSKLRINAIKQLQQACLLLNKQNNHQINNTNNNNQNNNDNNNTEDSDINNINADDDDEDDTNELNMMLSYLAPSHPLSSSSSSSSSSSPLPTSHFLSLSKSLSNLTSSFLFSSQQFLSSSLTLASLSSQLTHYLTSIHPLRLSRFQSTRSNLLTQINEKKNTYKTIKHTNDKLIQKLMHIYTDMSDTHISIVVLHDEQQRNQRKFDKQKKLKLYLVYIEKIIACQNLMLLQLKHEQRNFHEMHALLTYFKTILLENEHAIKTRIDHYNALSSSFSLFSNTARMTVDDRDCFFKRVYDVLMCDHVESDNDVLKKKKYEYENMIVVDDVMRMIEKMKTDIENEKIKIEHEKQRMNKELLQQTIQHTNTLTHAAFDASSSSSTFSSLTPSALSSALLSSSLILNECEQSASSLSLATDDLQRRFDNDPDLYDDISAWQSFYNDPVAFAAELEQLKQQIQHHSWEQK